MLDVRRLRMLREVAARGTIAATAEALGYTPSAVSQHLIALERETGASLLERDGRSVRLTDAAERLVSRTEAVLAQLEAAEAELAPAGDVRGTVTLACFPTAAATLAPIAMAAFAAAHPDAEVVMSELEPEQALPALKLGEADVAVVHEYDFSPRGSDPGVELRPLLEDDILVAVPDGHPAAGASVDLGGARRRALGGRLPRHRLPSGGGHRMPRGRLRAADRGAQERLPRGARAGRRGSGRCARAAPGARGRPGRGRAGARIRKAAAAAHPRGRAGRWRGPPGGQRADPRARSGVRPARSRAVRERSACPRPAAPAVRAAPSGSRRARTGVAAAAGHAQAALLELGVQPQLGGDAVQVACLVGHHEGDPQSGRPARPVRPTRWM